MSNLHGNIHTVVALSTMCKGETIIGHAICEEKKMSSLMKDAIKEHVSSPMKMASMISHLGVMSHNLISGWLRKCITGITFLDRPVVTTLSLKRNLM